MKLGNNSRQLRDFSYKMHFERMTKSRTYRPASTGVASVIVKTFTECIQCIFSSNTHTYEVFFANFSKPGGRQHQKWGRKYYCAEEKQYRNTHGLVKYFVDSQRNVSNCSHFLLKESHLSCTLNFKS